ncbi:MAG: helix-turn-helix transcriptional regulator [Coleofasciculus sp. C1-SOL-03]|jgi:transcriptional regulator with XRE-family HTH domain|uniref:helix-turn-helix domain-containing protein n=1 Tax=Coleofasciculus sp. C1-SOL-03 TaxID=3069522 RepID=UPI0032F27400
MVDDKNSNSNPESATLKLLRQRLSMTQEELAQELGTTSRTIRRHETGERQIRFSLPQIKRLIELMQRAGMSADDLPDDVK